jgi:chromate transport protein ChrA
MHINLKTLKTIGVLVGIGILIYLLFHFFWQIVGLVILGLVIWLIVKQIKKQKV